MIHSKSMLLASTYVNSIDFEFFCFRNIEIYDKEFKRIKFNSIRIQTFLIIYIVCIRMNKKSFKLYDVLRRAGLGTIQMRTSIVLFVEAGLLDHEDRKEYFLTQKYYDILDNMTKIWDYTLDKVVDYNHFDEYRRSKKWVDTHAREVDIKHLLKKL